MLTCAVFAHLPVHCVHCSFHQVGLWPDLVGYVTSALGEVLGMLAEYLRIPGPLLQNCLTSLHSRLPLPGAWHQRIWHYEPEEDMEPLAATSQQCLW